MTLLNKMSNNMSNKTNRIKRPEWDKDIRDVEEELHQASIRIRVIS